jgi:Family of unknown function (DUF6088)
MTTSQHIQAHISALPTGEVFTPKSLQAFGSRASVDQVLSRLVKRGVIQREARGVYSKPVISRFTGQPIPAQMPAVLEAMAETHGETIALHGAVAVNYFDLSTQNQLRPVYLTTGRSRQVKIGHQAVQLKHVNPKHLLLGNSKAGLALTAMRYLGKHELRPELVQQIRGRLEPSEWQELQRVLTSQPSWLIGLIYQSQAAQAQTKQTRAAQTRTGQTNE